MSDILITATVRPGDLAIVKFEDATLEQVEAGSSASDPFNDDLKAKILEIAAKGKRVHLMACPGTAYLTGARVYQAFEKSQHAFAWAHGQASAV
jgi:hypothetical protein